MNLDQPKTIKEQAVEAFATKPHVLETPVKFDIGPTGSEDYLIVDDDDNLEFYSLNNNLRAGFTGMHLTMTPETEDLNRSKIEALEANKRGILKLIVQIDEGYNFNLQDYIKSNPTTNLLKKCNQIFIEKFGQKYDIHEENGMNINLGEKKVQKFREYLVDLLAVIEEMIKDYKARN